MSDPTLTHQAAQELARRLEKEKGRYYTPNGGIERWLQMVGRRVPVGDRKIHIVILRAGNGVGKSCLASNLASYLSGDYSNKYLDAVPCLKNYRRPNRGRIVTTSNAAETVYDEELAKWLPEGRYEAVKGGHKFNQVYRNRRNGSVFDIFTFDRESGQSESTTIDWAIIDEPMSRRHFSGLKRGMRFGGIIFMVFTALEGSGWYKHTFETPERLGVDVHVMELSSEENCKQHGVRGILEHETLESMWADFEENELPARKDGKYMASAGLVYPTFVDAEWTEPSGRIVGHIMNSLEGYHRECYDAGMFTMYHVVDPHDRKPFAMAWKLVFPNEDRVTVAEWPDDTMRYFHKLKSCNWDIPKYARMIKSTEMLIAGRPADQRIMDPNFGNAPKATSKSTVVQEFYAAGREESIRWPMEFSTHVSDAIDQGHIAVRAAIGDPAHGIRPKNFVMAHCKNTRWGFGNYGYAENRQDSRGLSERAELQFKDFPDLDRLFEMFGAQYVRRIEKDSYEYNAMMNRRREMFRPKRVEKTGYVGMA